ncbi:MAG: 2-C-methyl-D-erythritol 4-phosphate cytidylyltransferase [Rhodoferax sp.]
MQPDSSSCARLWVLLPCAGSGSRSGATGPKQYATVAGRPMVLHTLDAFLACSEIAGVLVAVSPGDNFWHGANTPARVRVAPCGGETRAHSVANGLQVLREGGAQEHDWVLVHDAARCLITPELILTLVAACRDDAVGGLLALPVPDTIKQAQQGRVCATVERGDKWLAQTPQMFRLGALQQALQQPGATITDEASAMEAAGHNPKLVVGSARNFKVTYPQDFALADAVLRSA